MIYFMLLLLRPCPKCRGPKKIKSMLFHQYSWNSEVETTWIILIGWPHKTSIRMLWMILTRHLMGSTDQADPSCFYLRISWILMERIMMLFLFLLSSWFSAVPQKPQTLTVWKFRINNSNSSSQIRYLKLHGNKKIN